MSKDKTELSKKQKEEFRKRMEESKKEKQTDAGEETGGVRDEFEEKVGKELTEEQVKEKVNAALAESEEPDGLPEGTEEELEKPNLNVEVVINAFRDETFRKIETLKSRISGLESRMKDLQEKQKELQNYARPEEVLEGNIVLQCIGCNKRFEIKEKVEGMIGCPHCGKNNLYKNARKNYLESQ